LLLTRIIIRVVHFVMQQRQLLGIASRAEGRLDRSRTAASHDREAA
jgi:hypothetical protein